jgi:hypothetical protein
VPVTAPKKNWKWFCEIEEYQEFKKPVPFKIDGQYLEQVTTTNGFRPGVRRILQTSYERILDEGSATALNTRNEKPPSMPPLDEVKISEVDADHALIVLFEDKPKTDGQEGSASKGAGHGRRSVFSNMIGGRAEEIAMRFLRETLTADELQTLKSVADENYGWDIEYHSRTSRRILIEVKGTSGRAFPNVEFTANEWDAARMHRNNFWLYLVSNCTSRTADIQKINDPYGISLSGKLEAQPLLWRLKWIKT